MRVYFTVQKMVNVNTNSGHNIMKTVSYRQLVPIEPGFVKSCFNNISWKPHPPQFSRENVYTLAQKKMSQCTGIDTP